MSTADIVNPATGETYVEAPLSGQADVDAAFQAAARAFKTWRKTTPGERSLLLFRVADALEARKDEFVEAECRNTGKPSTSCATVSSPESSTTCGSSPPRRANCAAWRADRMSRL